MIPIRKQAVFDFTLLGVQWMSQVPDGFQPPPVAINGVNIRGVHKPDILVIGLILQEGVRV